MLPVINKPELEINIASHAGYECFERTVTIRFDVHHLVMIQDRKFQEAFAALCFQFVFNKLKSTLLLKILILEQAPKSPCNQLNTLVIRHVLDQAAEFDLKAAGEFEAKLTVHDVGQSALSGLTVYPNYQLVGAPDIPWISRYHMARFGTTQRQIAAVSAKNHRHSVENSLSQFRVAYSIDEILSAPPITYPLTLPMCSPISDGAAATIVATAEGLKRCGIDKSRAIRVLASVVQTGSDREPSEVEKHCTALAARRAYEKAGIGPRDVSVAEVHDATAMGEIIQIENLGL